MTTLDEQYLSAQKRLAALNQEHAVATARNEQKLAQRDALRDVLIKAGINPDNIDEEIQRLEQEEFKLLSGITKQLDEFESALKSQTTGVAPVLVAPVTPDQVAPPPLLPPSNDTFSDIDIA